MTEQSFSLVPFPDLHLPNIQITGRISRRTKLLNIYYSISGRIENILFPEVSRFPKRTGELWKTTCFEFFISQPDDPQYWEFNLSPSGNWNTYHIGAYRRLAFREETSIQRLRFSVQREPGCLFAEAAVDMSPIITNEYPIQAAIASIIQSNDGHETFWALTHPNPQPDFHSRESFTLLLAE